MLGLYSSAIGLVAQSRFVQAIGERAVRNVSYLGRLAPGEGSTKTAIRVGRGPASGKGKTSGRGQKGQKARGKVPQWLEGGQTPFYKRFPIIGFKRPHRREYAELDMRRVQDFWDNGRIPLKEGETLTMKVMHDCGLITGPQKDGVKILGRFNGEYRVPLNVEASKATSFAIKTIEKAGYTYKSVYHTTLGLRAHLNPDWFLLKKGYVPMQARPTHKRDIAYYSNPEKRGYLLDDRSLLLDHVGKERTVRRKTKKSALDEAMEKASTTRYSDYTESGRVRASEL